MEIVGRDRELDRATGFLTSPGFGVLVLRGEAGIGKTALWRNAVGVAGDLGHRVLTCTATGSEAALSFTGLIDLLDDVPRDRFEDLPEPQRRALRAALLLEGGDANPHAVAAALLGLVRVLADQRPTTLAVDDVQWLDPSTATVVAYACRRLETEHVRVLLAERSPSVRSLPLGLGHHPHPSAVATVDLGPLSLGAMHRLLSRRLGVSFARPVLRRVHELSGGNPLFALELARALVRTAGDPGAGALIDLPAVPDTLRGLIRHRLEALGPHVDEVLELVAASGDVTVGQLEAASESAQLIRPSLDAAIEAGILELTEDRPAFVHALYGVTVYAEIPPFRRRELHRRLARVVVDVEARARHLALATDNPSASVARELEGAATQAGRRGAPAAAAALAEAAASLTPPAAVDDRRRVLVSASGHHMAAGDPRRAREILEDLARDLPPGRDRAHILWRLADTAGDDVRRQAALCDQALAEASGDEPLAVTVHLQHATLSWLAGDFHGARQHARRATHLAEQLKDEHSLAIALAELAHAEANLTGRIPEPEMRRARALEQAVESFPPFLRPSYRHGSLLLRLEQGAAARPLLQAELDRARATGDEGSIAGLACYIVDLERRAGRWAEASVVLREASALAAQASVEQEQRAVQVREAQMAALTGDVDRCRSVVSVALPRAERAGWDLVALQLRGALGLLELSLGDARTAHDCLHPATCRLREMGVAELSQYLVVENDVEALVALGALDDAEDLADWLASTARAAELPWAAAMSSRAWASIRAARGDLPGARAAITQALGHHERFDQPFELARTWLVAGSIERRARQKRSPREALARARQEFDRLGARRWADRAAAELERIGGRPPATGELTTTERRVAELVAAGRSNPEVAAALHVTRKTVEKHVSRIFVKFGVRSRVELTRHLLDEVVPDRPDRTPVGQ